MRTLLLMAVAAVVCTAAPRPMFNGKDLTAWNVDTPGLWTVKDGVVIGKHAGLKYNDFLRTKKHYRNFVMRLNFRLVNGEGDSGVQFRSKPFAGSHEFEAHQADIGQQYWGCLYDESRRKKVLVQAPAQVVANLDKTGWNAYVITAITLDLNGRRTVDYTEADPNIPQAGFIALQVHSGPKIEVHFKDVTIEELP